MKPPIIRRKRYNPASFKKKVDTQTDSYLPKGAPGKMVICPGCHALSIGKRWRLDEAAYAKHVQAGTARQGFCPAGEKIRDGYPSGQGTLQGPFPAERRGGSLRTTKN